MQELGGGLASLLPYGGGEEMPCIHAIDRYKYSKVDGQLCGGVNGDALDERAGFGETQTERK